MEHSETAQGRNVLLYASGSISCYKACALISLLKKRGHSVTAAASKDALRFVGRASFEGLSHARLRTDLFDDEEPIPHIALAQNWADIIIAYPASADCINRLAAGLCDDLFGAICLANNFARPLLIAPAMNSMMFAHPAVQKSLETLRGWGAAILGCGEGLLACGTTGAGRLLEPEDALAEIEAALARTERKQP
ncbi:MAG: flavoprotein [Treponemataceae bacterium]|nr:flavoprotein [Treponemataceae bacterium]